MNTGTLARVTAPVNRAARRVALEVRYNELRRELSTCSDGRAVEVLDQLDILDANAASRGQWYMCGRGGWCALVALPSRR